MSDSPPPKVAWVPQARGGVALDLHEVVGYRQVRSNDGATSELAENRIDRAEAAYRAWGMDSDAASRAGVTTREFRRWRTEGARYAAMIMSGEATWADLSPTQRQYIELDDRCTKAEAESRLFLLGLAGQLARGGIEQTETLVETDAGGRVLKTKTTTKRTLPDKDMIRMILEKRFPRDYGRTAVELTGADGGPVQVEHLPGVESFIEDMARVAASLTRAPAPPPGELAAVLDAEVVDGDEADTPT